MEDEVVLMAIISPASTIGRTNPGLHFVSSFLLLTYSGDRTTAEARASTMANALCDEFWLAVLQAYVAMLVRLKKPNNFLSRLVYLSQKNPPDGLIPFEPLAL